jgi:hypothetical protein
MFIGNYEQLRKIALRIREAALELGVKRIVVGECGHAWRVAYSFWNTLVGIGAGRQGPVRDRAAEPARPAIKQPMHICELTHDLIRRGAIAFDKERNDDRVITFHDSCNVARGSRMGDEPGGQFTIPRTSSARWPTTTTTWRRHHARGHLLLRWWWRPADRRPARAACQGRVAAHGSAQARGRCARRELHGHHLRHLQGPVQQGAADTTASR